MGTGSTGTQKRDNRFQKAGLAYSIRFAIGVVLYAVGVVVGESWARSLAGSPWRFVVVCLPMVGAAVCVWAMLKLVREADELQSRKLLEALVFSVAGTILTCMAYGFMQDAGAPLLASHWITPVWGAFMILGTLRATWRYR